MTTDHGPQTTKQKLTSPSQVRALLKELDFRPRKTLGQNFLIDANILDILVRLADVTAADAVLEIGPGLGVLTEALLERAGRVVAVEKDRKLCAHLRKRFAGNASLELIEADALGVDLEGLIASGITRMVSNLPYAAGNRILVDLAGADTPLGRMVVTVQRDVAERLAAVPGTKDFSALTILIQLDYDVKAEKQVSPTCFVPRPRVWSTLVSMKRKAGVAGPKDRVFFRELVKWAFSQRRKQLGTVLRRAPCFVETKGLPVDEALRLAGIDPTVRPEDVSVAEWVELANALTTSAG